MFPHTITEFLGHVIFNFTRSVAENYDFVENANVSDLIGYNALEDTGKEWYSQPSHDEVIYQEYSNSDATSLDYLTTRQFVHAKFTNASSTEDSREEREGLCETNDMAWKRLRPSITTSIMNSLYFGFLISVVSASVVGVASFTVYYFSFQTQLNCEMHSREKIPIELQWVITLSEIISVGFLYFWFFLSIIFYFCPFQLSGVKRRLVLLSGLFFLLDSVYRIAMQVCGVSHSKLTALQRIPAEVIFCICTCSQIYIIKRHFCTGSLIKQVKFVLLFIAPYALGQIIAIVVAYSIYPAYKKQDASGKLLIAVFSPLIVFILKGVCRICIQRFWCQISHPGTSFVLLSPMYCASAIMLRLLQADLQSLESIALTGAIHGIAEVIDRTMMAVIDHICHQAFEDRRISWGGFRTPRRERLATDISIMSMLYESSAVITVNTFLHLYQYFYTYDNSPLKLLPSFAVTTSVPLGIEWIFTSVSIFIETRYKNLPVMAVWRNRWKRHLAVAFINAVMVSIWTTSSLLIAVEGRFKDSVKDHCDMPFNL
ncbi:uncharacterized protein [Montipora foliosa]|uniref:uncharacterized protein n=1 Tax=Montipora foliosa TaxID=591990 RepID=UPI0035F138D5